MTRAFRLLHDADLSGRNTFGVPARAPLLVEVADAGVLPSLFATELDGANVMVLGGGSNVLFAGDPEGPLLASRPRMRWYWSTTAQRRARNCWTSRAASPVTFPTASASRWNRNRG